MFFANITLCGEVADWNVLVNVLVDIKNYLLDLMSVGFFVVVGRIRVDEQLTKHRLPKPVRATKIKIIVVVQIPYNLFGARTLVGELFNVKHLFKG